MKKNKALKILTLVCFCLLLTGFIVFKSGAFDKYFKTNNEELLPESNRVSTFESRSIDTLLINAVDTVRVNPTMLPTSKSIIIFDQKIKFPMKDSLKMIQKK